MPPGDELDLALQTLAPHGHQLGNGLTNHAPMVAEVLCGRDRPADFSQWLESYRHELRPWPEAIAPIPGGPGGWRQALGDGERVADWRVFVAEDLDGEALSVAVDRWMLRLAPGLCADALHALIRSGHALRALGRRNTPERRRELADAIAIWAATYQTLPVADPPATTHQRPNDAIERVPRLPEEKRRPLTTIVGALGDLEGFAPFSSSASAAALEGDPAATIDELAETFARVFLTNAHDALSAIVFAHGVTGAVALRAFVSHLQPETVRAALGYAWQAACALYVALGTAAPAPRVLDERRVDEDGLLDAALATGDEHALKFVDACLREHARSRRPVFAHAAEHAVSLLSGV